jgi:hypothetical protein
MTFINHETREINCKIVYYGPGASGKYSNLTWIYQNFADNPNTFTFLPSQQLESLWFDFSLPRNLNIRGFGIRVHLYTISTRNLEVPFHFSSSYEIMLKGVDGLVFVADSQSRRIKDNIESLSALKSSLNYHRYDLMEMPYALQLNKRDLSDVSTIHQLKSHFVCKNEPVIEAVANDGIGVLETFQAVTNQIVSLLRDA